MSNFSNIGFDVASMEDFQHLIDQASPLSRPRQTEDGTYHIYVDGSGAELCILVNHKNECTGANPHFNGKSRRTVCLTHEVERPENELDGAFHAWADPTEQDDPDSGAYPFVFDVPDFKAMGPVSFPKNFDIQLTAFAQELSVYGSEKEFAEGQGDGLKYASQSFIPSGLFSAGDGEETDPPQAMGIFAGVIKEVKKKRNLLTNQEFYWLLVDTLGGEIDVVADTRFFERTPAVKGVVHGSFWLSGRLLDPVVPKEQAKPSFLKRLFGR